MALAWIMKRWASLPRLACNRSLAGVAAVFMGGSVATPSHFESTHTPFDWSAIVAKQYKPVTLVHPETKKTWQAESKVQEVNLLNRGWQKQKEAPANKSNPAPQNKSQK